MQKTKFKKTEIGEIPENWEVIKLGDVCLKIGSGITPRGGEKVYKNSGTVLIRSQNVYNNQFNKNGLVHIDESIAKKMENVTVEKNDVLLNITGDSVARCCTVPEEILPARVNQHVAIVRTDQQKVDLVFLKYYLTSPKMQEIMLSLAQSGGTRNALTKGMIEKFIIPKPERKEQSAIVDILSDLDAQIEVLQQQNETLEAIGKTLFKHWFVDFEFPNEEGKSYKSSGGAMVDSELGEIPKGWEMKPLDTIAEFLNGLALQKFPPTGDNDLPVIKIKELKNGVTDATDYANRKIGKEYVLQDGDILFSWSGSLEVAIWTGGEGALNQHLFKVSSKIYPKWLYYYWTIKHLEEFKAIASGKATTMGHIQRRHLAEALTTIPDRATMDKISDSFNPILEAITKNAIRIRTLISLRGSLLPKLMTGKIRVQVSA